VGFTDVTGIDRSATEVARAARAGITGVIQADATEFLRGKDDTYGLISLFNVFEHLTKAEILALLRSLHRSLRPGGRILAVTPNGLSPFAGTTRYWDFSHETSFTPAAWRQLALATGFEPPTFEEFGPIPHSISGIVRSGLWRVITLFIQAMAYVEVGGPRDAARVYTADMKVILTK
jgi:SAM-dependent methyltransferase